VERLLGLGLLVMIAADAVVGARLLLLAVRRRQLPELTFGAAFVLLGVVGYPLAVSARSAPGGDGGLLAAALAAQDLGALAIYVATWQVFRPDAVWALRGVSMAGGVFLASLLGDSYQAGMPLLRDGGPWYYLGFTARAMAFVWAAAEAFRYHAMMRRRLALGLGDPVVADRFRLWGLSAMAVVAAFAAFLAGRLWVRGGAMSAPVLIATSLAGIVAGVTVLLAFSPPRAYLRHVAARAARRRQPGDLATPDPGDAPAAS
jgi:hypothetical protein